MFFFLIYVVPHKLPVFPDSALGLLKICHRPVPAIQIWASLLPKEASSCDVWGRRASHHFHLVHCDPFPCSCSPLVISVDKFFVAVFTPCVYCNDMNSSWEKLPLPSSFPTAWQEACPLRLELSNILSSMCCPFLAKVSTQQHLSWPTILLLRMMELWT